MKNAILIALLAAATAALCGCQSPYRQALAAGDQLQTRSYQTRAFDTTDRVQTLRAIISTMQDLGFVIDKADATLGTVSATKFKVYELRLTATVRPRGSTQLLVRASAQFKAVPSDIGVPVEDPAPYRDFFAALEKSLFLAAQNVD